MLSALEVLHALHQAEAPSMGEGCLRVRLSSDALRAWCACMLSQRFTLAGAGRGDDYMSAIDLPPSESESGSDAEAPGTLHNPNRPSRRAAPGSAWAWRRRPVNCSLQMHTNSHSILKRSVVSRLSHAIDGKRLTMATFVMTCENGVYVQPSTIC